MVVKYYYSKPIYVGTYIVDSFDGKTALTNQRQGRRYTMAAIFDADNHVIKIGLAICQAADNFCKETGRQIAYKNAIEKPFHVIKNFSGRRNDYADEIMRIMIQKEDQMRYREFPALYNNAYEVDF